MTRPLPRPPRIFQADKLLRGEGSLDGYPCRYICLVVSTGGMRGDMSHGSTVTSFMDTMLSAVEMLEGHGWELVTLEQGGTVAFLRRRSVGGAQMLPPDDAP